MFIVKNKKANTTACVLCEKKSEVRDNSTGNVMTSTWLLSSALVLLLLAAMPQLLHSQRGNDVALALHITLQTLYQTR